MMVGRAGVSTPRDIRTRSSSPSRDEETLEWEYRSD